MPAREDISVHVLCHPEDAPLTVFIPVETGIVHQEVHHLAAGRHPAPPQCIEAFPVCLEKRMDLGLLRVGNHPDIQAGLQIELQEKAEAVSLAQRIVSELGRHGRGEMHPVEVSHDLSDELGLIVYQLMIEQASALEGELAQHSLAKPVDSENRRFVEAPQRIFQTLYGMAGIFAALHELKEKRIRAHTCLKAPQCIVEL